MKGVTMNANPTNATSTTSHGARRRRLLITLSGWKHLVLKGPGPVFSDLWGQMQHAMLWQPQASNSSPISSSRLPS